jgi:hypothetical protein
MVEKDIENLDLLTLVVRLDNRYGNAKKKIGAEIRRLVDEGEVPLGLEGFEQAKNDPNVTHIIFEKCASSFREEYQKHLETYQEYERRLGEYQANKKKP